MEALWRFNVTSNNETCFGLHEKFPALLPTFNRIYNSSIRFDKSPQYQIQHETVQGKRQTNVRTDGRTGGQAGRRRG